MSTLLALTALSLVLPAIQDDATSDAPKDLFEPLDVFQLEVAADPQVSPDGSKIVYVRRYMDIMEDRARGNLWIVDVDGGNHRPLTSGTAYHSTPSWSPNGDRLLWVSTSEGSAQIWCRWNDTGQTASLTRLVESPGSLVWSPDGRWIAFAMNVPADTEPLASMPPRPEGAKWAEPARVIETVHYRQDGGGFDEPGHRHLFVVPSDGGTPRRLTTGDFDVNGSPSWSPDGSKLYFSSYRGEEPEFHPEESEVFELTIETGALRQLTDRVGPDNAPLVSPDGTKIAYTGFDDTGLSTNTSNLRVMDLDGKLIREIAIDRGIGDVTWGPESGGLYFTYEDRGDMKLAFQRLAGDARPEVVAEHLGGTEIGRPYVGGTYSLSRNGTIAYELGLPQRPADVAVVRRGGEPKQLTHLNEDLFAHKTLGSVEEVQWASSYDGRLIQGWLVRPPHFDPAKKYPLVLEIHGGPFAAYGPFFAAELQLYAAAGYVVLYCNPRGSTSYGQAFAMEIHHDYPSHDYDDLMDGVDKAIEMGFVDPERLFVTGGSGGGCLSAWIVGHTDRFAAAVVAKPVIDWISFTLTADESVYFTNYWQPAPPWEALEHYWKHSPLAYVGNVTTPTMLLTGEEDHRTPISQSEEFYQALKLRKVDAAMVRIPGAGHGITARPSNLIQKVVHVLAWFERYDVEIGRKGEAEGDGE
ncbi:MAG: S9 family peptidase [Planctomycetota bacterium]